MDGTPDALTDRERQVVQAVIAGGRNRDIAQSLGVSEQTIKNHLYRIYQKLQVETRVQLAVRTLASRQPSAT